MSKTFENPGSNKAAQQAFYALASWFGRIASPTLILEGEKSENRHYIDLKKAATLMQNGSYQQIKEAGHLIPMEKPAETANVLKEFFNLT